MVKAVIFALIYLRNLPTFDGNHVRTMAATRMDLALRAWRRKHGVRGRP